ncbi:reverse transcriptase family protein, partial [Klebsiella pneumoniae]|uniref:reverse transcriptase family protein n=1 Tax=Klebsiella pneumoniae TaxID=573 RepID=UPI00405599CD
MPFGLKNAPITFQRLMDEFLRGINESTCQVYMDDLLVFSKTEGEHVKHLQEVFERVRHFELKLTVVLEALHSVVRVLRSSHQDCIRRRP